MLRPQHVRRARNATDSSICRIDYEHTVHAKKMAAASKVHYNAVLKAQPKQCLQSMINTTDFKNIQTVKFPNKEVRTKTIITFTAKKLTHK
jgi:hypothetical protein